MSYYAPIPQPLPAPDFELDLHGFTTAEVKIVLDELFEKREYKTVNLIVGKGINSALGPVLPSFVKNYLHERNISFLHVENRGTICATLR